tara:strand:- start:4941 stop:5618 length:678 start_codon:yes stop_codon:yes gene_type:complete
MSLKNNWKNETQAKKDIGNIKKRLKIGAIVEESIIKELVRYHPTKQINLDKVEWFKMKLRAPYNTPALYYKYKNSRNVDDISLNLCIKNLFGKYNRDEEYDNDVKNAFRNDVHKGTKSQYFINNTTYENNSRMGICNHCHVKTKNINTDHYNLSYKEIFDNFIQLNSLTLREIDIYENDNNEIRLKDEQLALKWLNYHDSRAKYRMLCGPCNSHFGAYGYKNQQL